MNFSLPPYWEHFKFDHQEIEANVGDRPGSYQGLSPEALYTSREDFLHIFNHPLVQGTLVDLGCGVGEGCLLYGSLFPERQSIGVEFEESRLNAGLAFKKKHQLANVNLMVSNLMTDAIPVGDTYFLYFPTGPVLDRVLTKLYESKKQFRIIAIESHGDLLPRLKKENWLKPVGEIPLKSPRHFDRALIFERTTLERGSELYPHTLSYEEKFLLVKDPEEWIGETLGLEWSENDRYELKTPPRTIHWKTVQEVLSFDQFDVKTQEVLKLRRLGELEIKTDDAVFHGFIRKILINPTFRLEISSGEKVEWLKIKTIRQGSRLCYASS